MLNKRVVIYFLLIISLIAVTGFVLALHTCQGTNSSVHGVFIGGECFNCGDEDGICPIEFGVDTKLCPGDPDCKYEIDGWWSENSIGTPAITSSEDNPFIVDLINGKTLYLVLVNTGKSAGETIIFNLYENDGILNDDSLGIKTGTVDSSGTAIANFSIEVIEDINKESDESISEVYFKADGIKRTIFINATYEGEGVASVCGDYDEKDACNDDDFEVGKNSNSQNESPIDSGCFYNKIGECNWNETTSKCLTIIHEEADANNPDNCNPASDIICSYSESENRIGNCDAGDDFFKVNYVSQNPSDCPPWTSGVIPCPQQLKVPFFGFYSFIVSIFGICLIYLFLRRQKQDL